MLLASLLLAAPLPAPSLAADSAAPVAAAPAAGVEELLLGVTLNEEDKGSFFAYRTAEGDLLFSVEDLRAMGFRSLPVEPREVGGQPHLSLRSLAGIAFDFDPDAVTARITAPPELLAVTVIDFSARPGEEVEYPAGSSAFLNYGVAARGGEGYDAPDIEAGAEAAFRTGDWLLFSDGIYRSTQEQDGFVRLQTRATWEDRAARERLTLGDQTLAAGELWSAPAVGGISFARIHRIDPYLVSHPMFGLAGQTPIPAEVRIYLDGVPVRTEKISPGEFQVRDLDAYGGDRRVEVVVRDAFGRETRYERPFYFTDSVLRRGLHEFSYGLGWLREEYGEASSNYGRPALSAFHRYGVTDAVTLGAAGEAGGGVVSAGPTLSLVAGGYGTVSLALSAGRMDGETGWAGVASHQYENRRLSTLARVLRSSAHYRTLLDEDASERAGTQLDLGVSYGTSALGTFSLAWRSRRLDQGEDRNRLGLDYRLGLHGKFSIFAALARVEQEGDRWLEAIAGVSYFPGRQQTVSVQYARQQDADTTTLEVSQDRTEGSGLAWRALAQRRGGRHRPAPVAGVPRRARHPRRRSRPALRRRRRGARHLRSLGVGLPRRSRRGRRPLAAGSRLLRGGAGRQGRGPAGRARVPGRERPRRHGRGRDAHPPGGRLLRPQPDLHRAEGHPPRLLHRARPAAGLPRRARRRPRGVRRRALPGSVGKGRPRGGRAAAPAGVRRDHRHGGRAELDRPERQGRRHLPRERRLRHRGPLVPRPGPRTLVRGGHPGVRGNRRRHRGGVLCSRRPEPRPRPLRLPAAAPLARAPGCGAALAPARARRSPPPSRAARAPSSARSPSATSSSDRYSSYAPAAEEAAGRISVRCDGPGAVSVEVSLDSGEHGGGFAPRQMRHAVRGDRLGYLIFTDAGMTTVWGDGSRGSRDGAPARGRGRGRTPRLRADPRRAGRRRGRFGDRVTVRVDW